MVGNGKTITKPIGRIGTNTGEDKPGVKNGKVGGKPKPRIISKRDLKKPPRPPSMTKMNGLLLKNYPKRAKTQGVDGLAKIRLQVGPSGKLSRFKIAEETGSWGFGEACIQTVKQGGRWTPAVDKRGRPGSYPLVYVCRFEVGF